MGSVVDQHRSDADPDPDHTPHFTHDGKSKTMFSLIHSSLVSVICFIIFNIFDGISNFSGKILV
jgi:hypothetical protein